jgi:hypothetical protein
MGFQKKLVSGFSEDLDFFFIGDFLANPYLTGYYFDEKINMEKIKSYFFLFLY